MSHLRRILAATALAALCAGCSTVEVWQKAELAQPQMQLRREGRLQFFEDHALSTLEQAEGANGKVGAGCGCR
jgi:hypothetical protein